MTSFSMRETGFSLPPQNIEALRTVDLHLYLGRHGLRKDLPGYGSATVGVEDIEYANTAQMVDELQPDRGDVLARETTSTKFRGPPRHLLTASIRRLGILLTPLLISRLEEYT